MGLRESSSGIPLPVASLSQAGSHVKIKGSYENPETTVLKSLIG